MREAPSTQHQQRERGAPFTPARTPKSDAASRRASPAAAPTFGLAPAACVVMHVRHVAWRHGSTAATSYVSRHTGHSLVGDATSAFIAAEDMGFVVRVRDVVVMGGVEAFR